MNLNSKTVVRELDLYQQSYQESLRQVASLNYDSVDVVRETLSVYKKQTEDALRVLNEAYVLSGKDLLDLARSFQIMPQTTVDDYLDAANVESSAVEALAKDWTKVSNDLWLQSAKCLEEEKVFD